MSDSPTFTLAEDGSSITCHRCGMTSCNGNDVRQRYCGNCHAFHEIPGPGYWMHEQSGVLRPAVEAYLRGDTLSAEKLAAMRGYLRQWIGSPVWGRNPHIDEEGRARLDFLRRRIDDLTSRPTIEAWLAAAAEIGIDPL